MNNKEDINKLVKKISQTLKVEKIILFGSYAYGKTNEIVTKHTKIKKKVSYL